jgi:uncharacterized membrane protein YbhN (UPF0104 family)
LPASPPTPSHRRLKQLTSAALIVVSLGFVAAQIVKGWPQLMAQQWRLSWPAAAGSFALLFVNFALAAWAWAFVFRDLGERVRFRETFAVIFYAQLGRYIPGKIWLILGQVYMAERLGYRRSSALTASVVQFLCGECGALVALAVAALGAGYGAWVAVLAAALAVAAAAALLVAPAWFEVRLNRWRARRGSEPVRLVISRPTMFAEFAIMTVSWLVHCLAFVLLAAAVAPLDAKLGFQLAFAYNFAYHVSFYVLFLPGGIGVREGALTALLAPAFGPALAGVIALLQRFWYLLGEAVSFLIALAIIRRAGPAKKQG